MSLAKPITVSALCVALEQRVDTDSIVTLRFNAPDDQALGINNLGDFIFKTSNPLVASQFAIGSTYTITLQ